MRLRFERKLFRQSVEAVVSVEVEDGVEVDLAEGRQRRRSDAVDPGNCRHHVFELGRSHQIRLVDLRIEVNVLVSLCVHEVV